MGALICASEWLYLGSTGAAPSIWPTWACSCCARRNGSSRVAGSVLKRPSRLFKGPIGFGAAALSTWLRSHPQWLVWLFRTSGAVLVGLGVQLALQRPL